MNREKILDGAYTTGYQICFAKAWNYWTKYVMATPFERRRMKMPEFMCEDCSSYKANFEPCSLKKIATERKKKGK